MARKLKTFTTSLGFFDLAVAAPSMKAALEAWGISRNLFHQGLAEETTDPDTIAAAMEKPGVVLRRAVGTQNPFREQADLPKSLPIHAPKQKRPEKRAVRKKTVQRNDPAADKAAIIKFEEAKARREKERRREENERAREQAAAEREDEHRQKAVAKAELALHRARARHEENLARLEKERQDLDKRLEAERQRWRDAEEKLYAKIRKASS
ncbi:MAG TPA: cell envelope biogenesis protein TolA [Rhizomicrobium sp.]|nr:cell envelope biogenesis protein TolA [Rhizomicrobium sp.]